MATTPNLGLPLVAAAQAQKHVTVNEALFGLDTLVQLAVLDKDLTDPPAGPSEGDRYIVAGPGPTGAWSGWAGRIARFQDGAWISVTPRVGWFAFVADEADLYTWDGTAWTSFRATLAAVTTLQNLVLLGIGTTADSTNPFAAKLNKALWTAKTVADGGTGDLRYTLNKEAAAKTLSFLLQTGFSGRAEIGLVGDDDLGIKVSADGTAWTEAVRIDRALGAAKLTGPVEISKNAFGNLPPAPSDTVLRVSGADGVQGRLVFDAFGPGFGHFFFRAAGGTALAPSALQANARIGAFSAFGYGATGYSAVSRAQINFYAAENWTDAAQGTRIEVLTTANGTDVPRTVLVADQDGSTRPGADNMFSLGSASARWSAVYAVSGAINTSDVHEKKVRGDLTEAELAAWGEVRPLIFQFLDAVAAKGEDAARLHAGFTAQAVAHAFAAQGLDPARYALWCRDPVLRPVSRTRAVSRPRTEIVEVEEPIVTVEEGRAVRRLRRRAVERPLVNRLPVFDEAGEPIPGLHHDEPVLESVEETVAEMQDTGEVRLGLRYEQCLVFEAAYLRALVAGLQREVARLAAARG